MKPIYTAAALCVDLETFRSFFFDGKLLFMDFREYHLLNYGTLQQGCFIRLPLGVGVGVGRGLGLGNVFSHYDLFPCKNLHYLHEQSLISPQIIALIWK